LGKEQKVQQKNPTINITLVQRNIGVKEDKSNIMPRAHVRGGRKAHNKRIRHRKLMANHQLLAIEALKKKIYEEAKERYNQEQNNK
jgi:hypothetical protein